MSFEFFQCKKVYIQLQFVTLTSFKYFFSDFLSRGDLVQGLLVTFLTQSHSRKHTDYEGKMESLFGRASNEVAKCQLVAKPFQSNMINPATHTQCLSCVSVNFSQHTGLLCCSSTALEIILDCLDDRSVQCPFILSGHDISDSMVFVHYYDDNTMVLLQ